MSSAPRRQQPLGGLAPRVASARSDGPRRLRARRPGAVGRRRRSPSASACRRSSWRIRPDRHLAPAPQVAIRQPVRPASAAIALASPIRPQHVEHAARRPPATSTAMMPCPGAGTHTSAGTSAEIRSLAGPAAAGRPRPAPARRSSPGSSLRSRVSRLPRIGRNTRAREQPASAARRAARCSCRSVGDGPSAVTRVGPGRVRRLPRGSTSASRGSSRGSAARQRQPVGQHRRHVLAAVHGEVDVAGQQRVLDFLDEQALAADLRQRRVREPIAGRLDDDDLARSTPARSSSSAATARA